MHSASVQCRFQADGGTVQSAVVVGSKMRRRRVAESSGQCVCATYGLGEQWLEWAAGNEMCGHSQVAGDPIASTSLLLRCVEG